MMVVYSRAVTIDLGEVEPQEALLPYVDMVNHSSKADMTHLFYDDQLDGIVILATKDIPKGTEILFNYSKTFTNLKFFLTYGFINPGDDQGGVMISLDQTSHNQVKSLDDENEGEKLIT